MKTTALVVLGVLLIGAIAVAALRHRMILATSCGR